MHIEKINNEIKIRVKGMSNIYGICHCCNKIFNKKRPNHLLCSNKCRDNYATDFDIARFDIFKRDNFTCAYCGKSSVKDKIELHIDHIFPKSKGGSNHYYNVITSCKKCNFIKNDIILSYMQIEYIWNYLKSLDYEYKCTIHENIILIFNKEYNSQ